jgi:hypothetical protein
MKIQPSKIKTFSFNLFYCFTIAMIYLVFLHKGDQLVNPYLVNTILYSLPLLYLFILSIYSLIIVILIYCMLLSFLTIERVISLPRQRYKIHINKARCIQPIKMYLIKVQALNHDYSVMRC